MSSKSFNYQLSVNFTWHRTDGEEIREKHRQALIETAQSQIDEDLRKEVAYGELYDSIRMDEEDGEEGVEYYGRWMLEKQATVENDDVLVL